MCVYGHSDREGERVRVKMLVVQKVGMKIEHNAGNYVFEPRSPELAECEEGL